MLIGESSEGRTVGQVRFPHLLEKITMLYIHLNPTTTEQLDRCTGERYDEGDQVSCSSGCEAHFDVNGESEYGMFMNPYPNSILSWVGLLPGSSCAEDLVPVDPETGSRPDWITVHYNEDTFLDGEDDLVPVWVVVVNQDHPDTHFAAAFRSRKKAAGMIAELLTSEG